MTDVRICTHFLTEKNMIMNPNCATASANTRLIKLNNIYYRLYMATFKS